MPACLPHALRRWLDRWPTSCAVCRSWQTERICTACIARYGQPRPRCCRCAVQVPDAGLLCGACLKAPPPYAHTVTAFEHRYPWQHLVAALKFDAALDLVAPLGLRLLDALQRPAAAPRPTADLIVPTPLSQQRLRQRGYNQAWEVARWLAPRLGVPARPDLLLRRRDTASQLLLSPSERTANVRRAFHVGSHGRARLHGRHVALVDDVMTTGATAREMAHTLLEAGAAGVQVWVLSRTPLDHNRDACSASSWSNPKSPPTPAT
ncbi:ComF family protein [Caldimonas brevitalea]|uniref:ComF family protein n=1 Tax=Caldimonas brevitalea TaxID=413882 RepID=UPI000A41E81C|nr:ComF family protein [Caldimonas brevitalea]